jgi:hypothetical protein
MMSCYYEWESFKNIYLEDSFVISIEESENFLSFTVEMVLTEQHDFFSAPNMDEQYCYKTGKIIFEELKFIDWVRRSKLNFTDANGHKDFGNIDFFILDKKGYRLTGDWGEVVIVSSPVKVVWIA